MMFAVMVSIPLNVTHGVYVFVVLSRHVVHDVLLHFVFLKHACTAGLNLSVITDVTDLSPRFLLIPISESLGYF